jgi:hypothetical protein
MNDPSIPTFLPKHFDEADPELQDLVDKAHQHKLRGFKLPWKIRGVTLPKWDGWNQGCGHQVFYEAITVYFQGHYNTLNDFKALLRNYLIHGKK